MIRTIDGAPAGHRTFGCSELPVRCREEASFDYFFGTRPGIEPLHCGGFIGVALALILARAKSSELSLSRRPPNRPAPYRPLGKQRQDACH
jgi:hypothetical protein